MSLADIQSMKALKIAQQNTSAINNMTNVSGNLFDKTNTSKGYWTGTVGSAVVFNGSSSWFSAPSPLAVKAGDVLNINLAYQSAYIGTDNNGNVIQVAQAISPAASKSYTIASGVTKAYINAYTTYLDKFMVTINSPMPSFYIPSRGYVSKWFGKNYAMLGDSITWQDGNAYNNASYPSNTGQIANGYGTLLVNKTGIATKTNYGISGASMARSTSYPTNGSISVDGQTRSFSTIDLVTILAGTNDFKLNVPIGTQGLIGDATFDDTTFYGAYRKLIEYLLTQKPSLKIILFTPMQRNNSGYDVNYTNSAGFKLNDYRNAVINIGVMYGIPVLDLYAVSSITALTFSTYLMDGLHPHDVGYARLFEAIYPFIEYH